MKQEETNEGLENEDHDMEAWSCDQDPGHRLCATTQGNAGSDPWPGLFHGHGRGLDGVMSRPGAGALAATGLSSGLVLGLWMPLSAVLRPVVRTGWQPIPIGYSAHHCDRHAFTSTWHVWQVEEACTTPNQVPGCEIPAKRSPK